jgi:hypothetical protein
MEARGRIELPIKVLQTFALPLGDRALENKYNRDTSYYHRPPLSSTVCSEMPAADALNEA